MTNQTTEETTLVGVAARPGRPRSPTAHGAILDAALDLFVERGFEGMSVEAVASRAGVGKATIYRRWSSKEEVVIDAVTRVFAEPVTPDTGDVREDLIRGCRDLQVLMSSSPTGRVFPRMAAEVARGSPLGRLYGQRVISPRRAILEEALRRGIQRGELPKTIDVELAVDQVVGSLLLRKLTGRLKRSDLSLSDRVIDVLLTGLRARQTR